MEMVVSEGGNISDSTTDADTDKPSPDLILSDKHEPSHIKGKTILKNNTNDKELFQSYQGCNCKLKRKYQNIIFLHKI